METAWIITAPVFPEHRVSFQAEIQTENSKARHSATHISTFTNIWNNCNFSAPFGET